jgi:HD-GYP domain-containing protein (c-di-GMP phosphodiesterase class II)
MTNLELNSRSTHQDDFVRITSAALAEAFGVPYSFWLKHGVWISAPDCQQDDAPDPTAELGMEDFNAMLDEVSSSRQPRVAGTGHRQLLLLPFAPSRGMRLVAIAELAAPPALLLRFANSFLREFDQRREIGKLHDENDALVLQVTRDFDELCFLRSLVEHLDLAGSPKGLEESVLNLLCRTLHAEGLALIQHLSQSKTLGRAVAAEQQIVRVGDLPLNDKQCRMLVDLFDEESRQKPVVRNSFQQTSEGEVFPGLHEFVLVSVSNGQQVHGWLLTSNRDQRGGFDHAGSHKLARYEFGTSEAMLLATAASFLATHASNLDLLAEKEQLLLGVVRAMVSAIEAKDPYTCGHSERVAAYSRLIAEHVGLDQKACEKIYLTGLLHDVGKIAIQDATLKKPGHLTDDEFSEIKTHPDSGWAILHDLQQLSYVLPGVVHHHERFDGTGYPDGLRGEAIPTDARIIAVADAYDAMTSDRPYRKGMPQERAEQILRDGVETHWDPKMVEAFFEITPAIIEIRDSYAPRDAATRPKPD